MAVVTFTQENFDQEVLKSSDIAIVDFWATWCGPCKREMPEVQALYEKYGNNEGDVIVLGVANPKSEEYPYNQDVTQPEVEQFLEDGGYTFPVVMGGARPPDRRRARRPAGGR